MSVMFVRVVVMCTIGRVYLFPICPRSLRYKYGRICSLCFLFFFSYFSHIKNNTPTPPTAAFPTRFVLSILIHPHPSQRHITYIPSFSSSLCIPLSIALRLFVFSSFSFFVIFPRPNRACTKKKNTHSALLFLSLLHLTLHTKMAPKQSTVVLLPGDGVGPEVIAEAKRVLELVAQIRSHKINISFKEELIGGASIDASGKKKIPMLLATNKCSL